MSPLPLTAVLVDMALDRLERRPSLEQPALDPWRCEACWYPHEDCECPQDDAETRYVDSLDAADLMGDM